MWGDLPTNAVVWNVLAGAGLFGDELCFPGRIVHAYGFVQEDSANDEQDQDTSMAG